MDNFLPKEKVNKASKQTLDLDFIHVGYCVIPQI